MRPVLQDPEQLQETANQILTAIIQGMRKEEPSNNVKLAATNALLNSLEFTRANFDKEVQNQNLQSARPDQPGSDPFVFSDGATLHHAGGLRSDAVSRHQGGSSSRSGRTPAQPTRR